MLKKILKITWKTLLCILLLWFVFVLWILWYFREEAFYLISIDNPSFILLESDEKIKENIKDQTFWNRIIKKKLFNLKTYKEFDWAKIYWYGLVCHTPRVRELNRCRYEIWMRYFYDRWDSEKEYYNNWWNFFVWNTMVYTWLANYIMMKDIWTDKVFYEVEDFFPYNTEDLYWKHVDELKKIYVNDSCSSIYVPRIISEGDQWNFNEYVFCEDDLKILNKEITPILTKKQIEWIISNDLWVDDVFSGDIDIISIDFIPAELTYYYSFYALDNYYSYYIDATNWEIIEKYSENDIWWYKAEINALDLLWVDAKCSRFSIFSCDEHYDSIVLSSYREGSWDNIKYLVSITPDSKIVYRVEVNWNNWEAVFLDKFPYDKSKYEFIDDSDIY